MKPQNKQELSDLVTAATELDSELQRFGEGVEKLRQVPLNSQKKMQSAAKMFQDLLGIDDRLAGLAQSLIKVLTKARQDQQAQVELLQLKSQEFEGRSLRLQQLLLDYEALGQSAAKLNTMLQEVADLPMTEEKEARKVKADQLTLGVELMGQLWEQSRKLTANASQEEFSDVARMAHSLEQQLQSARKQIQKLQASIVL